MSRPYFNLDNYDPEIADLSLRIERCIDRLSYLALYSISPDVLTQAICYSLRFNRLVKPEEDENLEQNVYEANKILSAKLWATNKEIGAYIRALGKSMAELVKNNDAQVIIQDIFRERTW